MALMLRTLVVGLLGAPFACGASMPSGGIWLLDDADALHAERALTQRALSFADGASAERRTFAAQIALAVDDLLNPLATARLTLQWLHARHVHPNEATAWLHTVVTQRRQHAAAQLMRIWSLCVDEDDVQPAREWLSNPAVAESAVVALSSVPGDPARTLLESMLEDGPNAVVATAILRALGHRGDPASAESLLAYAAGKPLTLSVPAYEAAARLGALPPRQIRTSGRITPEQAQRLGMAGLRAAQTLVERTPSESANAVFLNLTDRLTRRHHTRAALVGLTRGHSDRLLPFALGHLNTPGIRATAVRALATASLENLDADIDRAFDLVPPASQAALLEVMHVRQSPAWAARLEQANASEEPMLRFTAARLTGAPPKMEDIEALAHHGSLWFRYDAHAAALARADVTEEQDRATRPIVTVLEADTLPQFTARALQALAALRRPEDRARLMRAWNSRSSDYRFCESMLDWSVGQENTRDLLATIIDRCPDNAASEAFERLHALGVPRATLLAEHGIITTWHVAGPVARAVFNVLPQGVQADRPIPFTAGGRIHAWRSSVVEAWPGRVAIPEVSSDASGVVLGFTQIESPAWRRAMIDVDNDAPWALWFRGARVHVAPEGGAAQLGVSLVAGYNALMIAVSVADPAEGWRVRLLDAAGEPIATRGRSAQPDAAGTVGIDASKATDAVRNPLP